MTPPLYSNWSLPRMTAGKLGWSPTTDNTWFDRSGISSDAVPWRSGRRSDWIKVTCLTKDETARCAAHHC